MMRGSRGRDRMVVGLITTYAISAYHHLSCELESHSYEVYLIQHYVIKFVSGSSVVFSGFLLNKTDHQDITEILLKVALNTITNQLTFYDVNIDVIKLTTMI